MRKVIIDTYGSDRGAESIIRGAASAVIEDSSFNAVLVGDEPLCARIMNECGVPCDRYSVIHTTDFISNNEPPVCIYGGRDSSSMAIALETAKSNDECVGMVSPGNTGALLVGSMCRLGLVGSIRQPALASVLLFADNKYVCIADCGANIDCKAKELLGFAKMSDALMKSMYNVKEPRVGLLSVGREDGKGNTLTKEAFALLKESGLNFVGNVEASDAVSDYTDIIVCDGFSGNVLLKTIESIGKYSAKVAAAAVENGEESSQVMVEVKEHFDFNARGGAIFLGTSKPLVKMHGAAEERTVVSCIKLVLSLDDGDFAGKVNKAMTV